MTNPRQCRWTAPFDGGKPISSYRVTPYVGSTAQTPTDRLGHLTGDHRHFAGLTNGTEYTFIVVAVNSVGAGPAVGALKPSNPRNSCQPPQQM